jgi:hypothetical protein
MENLMYVILLFAMIVLGIIIYLIPSIIGHNKKHYVGIYVFNIFLGWTFLGWVIALVWAFTSPKKQEEWINTCDKCGLQKGFNTPLRLFVCPNCGHENVNA